LIRLSAVTYNAQFTAPNNAGKVRIEMKHKFRLLLLAGLCHVPISYSLDLVGVYDMAREKDPQIRQAREQARSARESKPQALANLLPNLGAIGGYDWVDQDINSSPTSRTGRMSSTQYDLAVQLVQPIFRRDLWIQLKQADDTIAQSEAFLADAEIELMVRTATAYFDVLLAADGVRTAGAEKEANARQLEQAQQRFDVGLIAITDVHESQAAYDNAVAAEIEAENNLSNAWEALQEIVGPIDEPIAKLGEELPLAPPDPNDVEQWAEVALKQNYGIIASREGSEIAKKNIEVQRSGHFPTLDLQGSYGTDYSDSSFSTDGETGIIGFEVNVPIYQGGGVTSRTRQARYDYQASMESLDENRRAVNLQVRNAYRGIISSISRVKALKSTVISFQSALESTQAGLEVGTRTMVDVLTVTSSLYEAERNYLSERYNYIINGLNLHQAASTLTPELLEKANGWLDQDDTVAPPG
jgi:outer membrane protein